MNYVEKYTSYKKGEVFGVSGIYKIINLTNNKFYLGSAKCFFTRFRIHIGDLLRNNHHNIHLQRAFNNSDINNFKFEIIEILPPEKLEERETFLIMELDATNHKIGYNINKDAKTRLGIPMRRESVEKMIKSLTGRKITGDALIKNRKATRDALCESVIQMDLNNNIIKEWECINDAAKFIGIDCTNIVAQLKGKNKRVQDFIFIYTKEYDPNKDYSLDKSWYKKKIGKFTKDNEFLGEYSAKELNELGYRMSNVATVCLYYENGETPFYWGKRFKHIKYYKNFIWKYI